MSVRAEIIATGRELLRLGLVVGSSGNVSAREGQLIVITPSALPYQGMTEDDLVSLGLDGSVMEGEREPSTERLVHLAAYTARPDAGAVVHSHSLHATAWSFLGEPLDTGTEEIDDACGGAVRSASFAPTGSQDLAELAVEALEGRRAVLLARHGVLALGGTLAEAFVTCQVVERQAQIAWLLRGRM